MLSLPSPRVVGDSAVRDLASDPESVVIRGPALSCHDLLLHLVLVFHGTTRCCVAQGILFVVDSSSVRQATCIPANSGRPFDRLRAIGITNRPYGVRKKSG